jgi:hypothetical protein
MEKVINIPSLTRDYTLLILSRCDSDANKNKKPVDMLALCQQAFNFNWQTSR